MAENSPALAENGAAKERNATPRARSRFEKTAKNKDFIERPSDAKTLFWPRIEFFPKISLFLKGFLPSCRSHGSVEPYFQSLLSVAEPIHDTAGSTIVNRVIHINKKPVTVTVTGSYS
ncbi:MAG: hypothetical protein KGH93_00880 [Patescibacteria group bacterium]|nr:hypothetical protein [Patescibacteria group bacterium]MDE1945734.1 hypothetical protein [Patescibacteria group bacterium]